MSAELAKRISCLFYTLSNCVVIATINCYCLKILLSSYNNGELYFTGLGRYPCISCYRKQQNPKSGEVYWEVVEKQAQVVETQ